MPDISCVYTLTTPGGTITFNDGSADQFYISEIPQGLSGVPARTPHDDVPYGDGEQSYNWFQTGRHILIEGLFLVTSVMCGPDMVEVWNQMEDDLQVATDSLAGLTTATGTLSWTPAGLSARSLTVRRDVELECPHDQNYLVRTFHFGLSADNPSW